MKANARQALLICLAVLLLYGCAAAQQADSSKLYIIAENGKVGFIDERGRIVIKPQFEAVDEFSEGFAEAKSKGKWGFIDTTGRWVVEPRFDETKRFSEGLAGVSIKDQWGFVDQTGNMVIEPRHSWIDGFSEGLAAADFVLTDDDDGYTIKHGYINKTGQIVIEPKFDFAYRFFDGLAIVHTDTGMGFINTHGAFGVEPRFVDVSEFSEGAAQVTVDLGETLENMNFKVGFIDQSGKWIAQPQFDSAKNFSNGMALIKKKIGGEDLNGYIDKTGRIIIEPRFKESGSFSEGLASVIIDGKEGYIDKTGRLIIKPQFHDAGSFSEDVAWVKIGDKAGYINKAGEIIIAPVFDSAENFVNGLAKVREGKRVGYINKSGKFVWSTSTWEARVAEGSEPSHPNKQRTRPQTAYFPAPALDNDDHRIQWYSKHLEAMGEPSLWLASRGGGLSAYRFLWLRSFHHPVAVRLNIEKDGTGILSAKVTTGMGGYEPGDMRTNKTLKLTKTQVDRFLEQLEKAGFWHQPTDKEPVAAQINEDGTVTETVGLDGAQWIIEGVENDKYKLVDEWSPKDGAHREAALLLINFADLRIKVIY